ncbi:hypothetical protein TIFTF001_017350 [Ficus carica]|uniref:Uncharacterized protein n=1 Tax=Ficus carica TaxID=3494 RepID=A0AA88DJ07_FICCA|nr:hypothetical protein TIFTF001_017350 [Ficus carica]
MANAPAKKIGSGNCVDVKENGSPGSRDRERVDLALDRKCDCFHGGGALGARRQLRSQAFFRRAILRASFQQADRQASLRQVVCGFFLVRRSRLEREKETTYCTPVIGELGERVAGGKDRVLKW